MITYSDLYGALRKEKYSEKLQKLPKNFLAQIEAYFKEKKEMSGDDEKDSIFGEEIEKTKKQLENAKSVVKELLLIRQKKVLNLAFVAAKIGIDKKDTDDLLDYEKELLESAVSKLEQIGKNMDLVLKGTKKKDLKNQLIRFTQDAPRFLDINNAPIGPFKKGDVANLPREIVSILTKSDQVEIIKED